MAGLSFRFRRAHWLSGALAAILAAITGNCMFGRLGPTDLLLLRRHQSELAEKRDQLIRENTELRNRIERLRSDDGYIERMIREELGYVRGDEIVYRFHDDRRPNDR